MPLPTLDQLLNFYRTYPLPTVIDAGYRNVTVSSLMICGPEDTPTQRLLGYPNRPDHVFFLDEAAARSSSTFLGVDDALFRRVLTGTGGFVYLREERGAGGTRTPLGPGALDLCRDASPLSGEGASARWVVHVTNNAILNHRNPGVPGLVPLSVRLSPQEIVALVSELRTATGDPFRIPDEHYGVNPSDHGQLSLMPNAAEIRDLVAMIQRADSPIAPSRRAVIIGALNHMIEAENLQRQAAELQIRQLRDAPETQARLERSIFYNTLIGVVGGIYGGMLISGKAAPLHRAIAFPFRGLYHLLRYPSDRGDGLRRWWQDLTAEYRYRGLSTVLQVGDNLTEMARRGEIGVAPDESTSQVAERIERRINSPRRAGSAIVIAPPGWGKEVLMQSLAGRAASNFLSDRQISQRARTDLMRRMSERNPSAVFIQTSANGIMAGTRYRGDLEERLNNIPREIESALQRGQRVILCIDEFHEILSAGRSQEQAVSLLEHWKGPLAKGTLRIVGFSTPDEMLKSYYEAGMYDSAQSRGRLSRYHQDLIARWERDPVGNNIHKDPNRRPLLNRFLRIDASPRPAAEMDAIVNRAIDEYRRDGVDLRIDADTIRLMSRLSESAVPGEGNIPRTALGLLDGVINQAMENTDIDRPVEIKPEDFRRYVVSDWPELAARFGVTASSNGAVRFVLRGAGARPSGTINEAVIRAQILQRYPHFLSQGGREALQDNQPLPRGPEAIANEFRNDFNALVSRVSAEYYTRTDSTNPEATRARADMDRRWFDQARDNGFVLRDGVPDSFLREVADAFIADRAARPNSALAGNTGNFRPAERLDVSEVERHMGLLRHVGR